MIKVTFIEEEKQFPIIVDFGRDKRQFTRKAAMELKNKLQLALDEMDVFEAMEEHF